MSIQPMPELTAEQYDALRSDIAANGVQVPIVKDQHGRIIDGNHRHAIAAELSITCPEQIVTVADDADAHDRAVSLNCARRHLTREQVRTIVANEIGRRPGDSDRAIAKRVGCSPTTVGTVRAAVSKLDSLEPEFTELAHRLVVDAYCWLVGLVCDGNGVDARTARDTWQSGVDELPDGPAKVWYSARVWRPGVEYVDSDRRLWRTGPRTHTDLTDADRERYLEHLWANPSFAVIVLRETWPDIFTGTADPWVLSKLDSQPGEVSA